VRHRIDQCAPTLPDSKPPSIGVPEFAERRLVELAAVPDAVPGESNCSAQDGDEGKVYRGYTDVVPSHCTYGRCSHLPRLFPRR
jgi:hypothetical protein